MIYYDRSGGARKIVLGDDAAGACVCDPGQVQSTPLVTVYPLRDDEYDPSLPPSLSTFRYDGSNIPH